MRNRHLFTLSIIAVIGILAICAYPIVQFSGQSTIYVADELSSSSITESQVHYVMVDGVSLAYREYGSGEPLLLICGFGATMDNWNGTFINILASQYHVYTYDHRGMGYSGDDNATPNIPQYADDAAGLMEALGYASMNTYGTSMGSSISMQLVISHPECVRKMVLSSATYSVRIQETKTLLGLIESIAADPNQTQGLRNEALANLAWGGCYDGLAGISKPVMLIVGTNDSLTPDSISVQIAGQINASWLVRLVGIPHSGQSYAPTQYADSVLNFLNMNESPFSPLVPIAPTNLTFVAADAKLTISWLPPSDDGGRPILSYNLYRCSTENGTYSLVSSVNGTSYRDIDLKNGQTYWYKVSAVNAVGEGRNSTSEGATPEGPADNFWIYAGLTIVVITAILILAIFSRRIN